MSAGQTRVCTDVRDVLAGKDEYDIRKQEEVLQESLMMVPDCQKKLAPAVAELQVLLLAINELHTISAFPAFEMVFRFATGQYLMSFGCVMLCCFFLVLLCV